MDRTEDNKARTLAWLLDHQGIEYEVSSHDQDWITFRQKNPSDRIKGALMVGTETMDDHDWDAFLARYVHFNVIERMRAGEVPKVAS